MGLTQPPKLQRPSRTLARFAVLVLMLFAAAVAIWHVTTQNNIALTEDGSVASLDVDPDSLFEVGDLRLRVVQHSTGPIPLVLLHDVDVGGSVEMADLAAMAADELYTVTVDLPGFGLSTRIPEPGRSHTVGAMADAVAVVTESLFTRPALLVGVGLGGKVAAEMAVTRPDLVAGLVMVDVDFWPEEKWRVRAQRLPVIGSSMTYTYETSGRYAASVWAPHCGEPGGWCPSPQQLVDRAAAAGILGSTASIHAFHNTPQSSLVPSDLDRITAPAVFVWSLRGDVPRESVERIKAEIPDLTVIDVDTWMAHLEAPRIVLDAVAAITG